MAGWWLSGATGDILSLEEVMDQSIIKFFSTIFDPEDGICYGGKFANGVYTNMPDKPGAEYFCINPLDATIDHGFYLKEDYDRDRPRRADINVSKFRSFMFEMDAIGLDDQLKIFNNCSIPFTSIVYSGSKSYHAILTVDGGILAEAHTTEGLYEYKRVWRRLAAKIDRDARKMGYEFPNGQSSFIDSSCQNASRLSRFPNTVRANGNIQSLEKLSTRISQEEFLTLLKSCPMIQLQRASKLDRPEKEVDCVDDFEAMAPPALIRKLKIVDWAGPENNYRTLFRLTRWAIDETNVTKEAFEEYLWRYTFPSLLRRGYPKHKLMNGVNDGYKGK